MATIAASAATWLWNYRGFMLSQIKHLVLTKDGCTGLQADGDTAVKKSDSRRPRAGFEYSTVAFARFDPLRPRVRHRTDTISCGKTCGRYLLRRFIDDSALWRRSGSRACFWFWAAAFTRLDYVGNDVHLFLGRLPMRLTGGIRIAVARTAGLAVVAQMTFGYTLF